MNKNNRTIVVTGAGSGIGRAIVRNFAEQGDSVLAFDISEAGVNETRVELRDYDVRPFVGDISVSEDIEAVVAAAAKAGGGYLDVMVSAAGVYDDYAGIEDTSRELWDRLISINLTGTFNAQRAAAAVIRPRPVD
jgi:NAD(P)-dependent dehydrogenase (short-subunit alcohol dehydrogenase family)